MRTSCSWHSGSDPVQLTADSGEHWRLLETTLESTAPGGDSDDAPVAETWLLDHQRSSAVSVADSSLKPGDADHVVRDLRLRPTKQPSSARSVAHGSDGDLKKIFHSIFIENICRQLQLSSKIPSVEYQVEILLLQQTSTIFPNLWPLPPHSPGQCHQSATCVNTNNHIYRMVKESNSNFQHCIWPIRTHYTFVSTNDYIFRILTAAACHNGLQLLPSYIWSLPGADGWISQ